MENRDSDSSDSESKEVTPSAQPEPAPISLVVPETTQPSKSPPVSPNQKLNKTAQPAVDASSASGPVYSAATSVQAMPIGVERQTTLVLQGYFTQDATDNQKDDVNKFFQSLEGSGRRSQEDETFFQVGSRTVGVGIVRL